jgi:hypothetical protein
MSGPHLAYTLSYVRWADVVPGYPLSITAGRPATLPPLPTPQWMRPWGSSSSTKTGASAGADSCPRSCDCT